MRASSFARRGTSSILGSVVAAVVLVGCAGSPDQSSAEQPGGASASSRTSESAGGANVETVASGLEAPWSIAFDDETAAPFALMLQLRDFRAENLAAGHDPNPTAHRDVVDPSAN